MPSRAASPPGRCRESRSTRRKKNTAPFVSSSICLILPLAVGEGLSANTHTKDTCREKECHEFVDDLCLFCKDRPSPPFPPSKELSTTNPHRRLLQNPLPPTRPRRNPLHQPFVPPSPPPIPSNTPPDFKDAYHARGQLAIQRGSLPRHAPKQPYSRRSSGSNSKPTPSPDTASETITEDDNDDSNSDTSESEHRKALPQPPAAPTLAPDPSVATTSNRKARRQQARFGPTPVVSHHPKDRDRERDQWQQQTRRPPGSGAGAADVTAGAAGSRRHQQAGTPEKEKRYWAEGGSVGSESEPVVAERGGPVGGGRGVVNGGGGSVGSGSSKAAAGGRRGGGAGEGGGEGV